MANAPLAESPLANVFLSIGSNIEPTKHIGAAADALTHAFGEVIFSSVYGSEPVGFVGDNFLNLVVRLQTSATVAEVQCWCKEYEQRNGRDLNAAKFTPRTIDLDVLLYDQCIHPASAAQHLPQLPRAEITTSAFVLKPLAELVPHWRHPELRETYQSLWQSFEQQPEAEQQRLWLVDFDWATAFNSSAKPLSR